VVIRDTAWITHPRPRDGEAVRVDAERREVGQIDGPRPSASREPSIWKTDVGTAHRKPSGNTSREQLLACVEQDADRPRPRERDGGAAAGRSHARRRRASQRTRSRPIGRLSGRSSIARTPARRAGYAVEDVERHPVPASDRHGTPLTERRYSSNPTVRDPTPKAPARGRRWSPETRGPPTPGPPPPRASPPPTPPPTPP